MEKLTSNLTNYLKKFKKPTAVSPHQEAINAVMELMGDKRYRYWCGRLHGKTPSQILAMVKQAQEGKNPQALFNWFIKNGN